MYYIKTFIIYSFIGYIFESLLGIIFNYPYESGFTYGPYTIIYGIGFVLMISLYNKQKYIKNKYTKLLIMFISTFIILSILECTAGYLLKELFNKTMWSYYNYPLNIGKYISIEVTTFWTFGILLFYKYINPLIEKIKIPNIIIKGIFIIIIIDIIISTLKLTNYI